MKYLIESVLYIYIIIFLFSCANRRAPSGGPKDIVGPKIIKTVPENKSTNFKGKELYFEFDEYVKEDNFTDKVIISPSIDSTFTYKVVKKKLYMEFVESLKPNTTYTVNLGEAIKDISESNSGIDLQLTFSTGELLDSLNIEGNVYDIATGKGLENILVGIYDANDTLNIFNSKPKYLAKTNKEGNYSLQNLKADNYILYAWNDKDKNLMYSNQTEPVGFESDTIELIKSIQNLRIPIQKFDLRKLKVLRQETNENMVTLEFNKGITDLTFKLAGDSTKKILYSFNKERNRVSIYNTFNITDSTNIRSVAIDSFTVKLDTTLKIYFAPKEEKKNNRKNKKEDGERKSANVSVIPSDNLLLNTDEIQLSFEIPISKVNFDTIYFFKDSLTIFPIKQEDVKWNNNQTELKINNKVDFKDTIRLKLGYGTFINVKGDSTTTNIQTFLRKTSDKFSSIGGTVNIRAENYIIVLQSKDGSKNYELVNQKNFKFDYLPPGTYTIKVVIDENGNKKWDRGDLKKRLEPEKIVYYKIMEKGKETNEITIKANWEILDNVINEGE